MCIGFFVWICVDLCGFVWIRICEQSKSAGMSLQVAVPAAAAAAEPPKKQATSLGGSLKTTAQRASAAHARNSSAFAAAPATAFGGGGGGGELYERATARSSWDPLASIRAKRGADVSNDPLGDLLAGDTFLIPPIYSGEPSYFLLPTRPTSYFLPSPAPVSVLTDDVCHR